MASDLRRCRLSDGNGRLRRATRGLAPQPSGFCVEISGPNVDDSAASFSNFATLPEDQVHTVAAPGVCIGSTHPDDLYAQSSGTSFAAPLVAGTVALCIASGPCAGLTPREIIQKIVSDSATYNMRERTPATASRATRYGQLAASTIGHLIRAGLY